LHVVLAGKTRMVFYTAEIPAPRAHPMMHMLTLLQEGHTEDALNHFWSDRPDLAPVHKEFLVVSAGSAYNKMSTMLYGPGWDHDPWVTGPSGQPAAGHRVHWFSVGSKAVSERFPHRKIGMFSSPLSYDLAGSLLDPIVTVDLGMSPTDAHLRADPSVRGTAFVRIMDWESSAHTHPEVRFWDDWTPEIAEKNMILTGPEVHNNVLEACAFRDPARPGWACYNTDKGEIEVKNSGFMMDRMSFIGCLKPLEPKRV